MRIEYFDNLDGIDPDQIEGFFVGWPKPPSSLTHINILKQSSLFIVAVDIEKGRQVVGFINCLTDGILTAYIPLLEVLPTHQGSGIGKELVQRLLDRLGPIYMTDIVCDSELQPFYERFGFESYSAMIRRKFECQNGSAD